MKTDNLLNLALETISNFVVIDASETIVYMNQVYSDMLGISLSKIIGKKVTDIIPGTRLPIILQTEKEELGDIMEFYHHGLKRKIKLICNRMPIFEHGKVIGACAMTLLQEMDEINHLYEELDYLRSKNQEYRNLLESLQEDPLKKIVGSSDTITELKKNIELFSPSNLSVLLTGETGVGKEVFASAIHQLSNRNTHPFVKINCAAIPKDLLESELFGYEGGAFTGALKNGKPGKFELANNGTLLLDEIGDMPVTLQTKLLRVLQEGEVERVGGTSPIKINVRLICSTNINIKEKIQLGEFREDLYYRINTVELYIPPLRERIEDIPALAKFFVQRNNDENGLNTKGISKSVLNLFQQYRWPGNIRELKHVIDRLSFLHPYDIITDEHCGFLKERIMLQTQNSQGKSSTVQPAEPLSSDQTSDIYANIDFAEIEILKEALEKAGGNRKKAAELLGISRATFYNKAKKHQLFDKK
ncbi:MAG: sigma 54-interacting transcriptional regulator [Firmicutes bacterium]|nr:sigma 54-interacting transcriptional regulator [Bacillota bacterium]